jgi:hypothetical protein
MKYDIQKKALPVTTRATVSKIVANRGDGAALLADVDKVLLSLPPRKGWDSKVQRRRNVKQQARGLLHSLEGVRPELRREVNDMITDLVLGARFDQMLDRDWLNMLIVSLRAHTEGEAAARLCVGRGVAEEVKASCSAYSKEDSPSLNIVHALAVAWRKHTRLAVSGADGAPFVEFVSTVLTNTGKTSVTDPRRLINRVLECSPELKGKPKK